MNQIANIESNVVVPIPTPAQKAEAYFEYLDMMACLSRHYFVALCAVGFPEERAYSIIMLHCQLKSLPTMDTPIAQTSGYL